jgi:hypothetical protein
LKSSQLKREGRVLLGDGLLEEGTGKLISFEELWGGKGAFAILLYLNYNQ